jgi:hypothetical protein
MLMKKAVLDEFKLVLHWKPTPIMDIVFESGLSVTKTHWSIQAVDVIITELESTGLSSNAIEIIKKQFYTRLDW